MTNEKAIELIHRLQDEQFDGPHGDERREALEMAVRALEGDGDMISRKAVMKEFSDFVRKSNNSDFAPTPTWNDAVSLVGSMPSAQTEVLACGSGELVQESDNLVKDLVKDCISRQQAIDAVNRINRTDNWKTAMIWALTSLPSAQPTQTNADSTQANALDCVSRQAVAKWLERWDGYVDKDIIERMKLRVIDIPSARQEYEPVTAEDFAKTMSENTLYGFMAWNGEALALMKEQGFVICKKAM